MPEITIPRTGAHLRKLFEILLANPEGLQAGEALKQLAASVKLTPYEAGLYESTGTPRFEKIVRLNKGIWSITDAGKKAFGESNGTNVSWPIVAKIIECRLVSLPHYAQSICTRT